MTQEAAPWSVFTSNHIAGPANSIDGVQGGRVEDQRQAGVAG